MVDRRLSKRGSFAGLDMSQDFEQRRLEERWLSPTTKRRREEKEKKYGKWCSEKNRYPTKPEAEKAQKKSFYAVGKNLGIYSCNKCQGFHLTKRTDKN